MNNTMDWAKDKEKEMRRSLHSEDSNWSAWNKMMDSRHQRSHGELEESIERYLKFYVHMQETLGKLREYLREHQFEEGLRALDDFYDELGEMLDAAQIRKDLIGSWKLSRLHEKFLTADHIFIQCEMKKLEVIFLRHQRRRDEKNFKSSVSQLEELTRHLNEVTDVNDKLTQKLDKLLSVNESLISQQVEQADKIINLSQNLKELQSRNETLATQQEELRSSAQQQADENEDLWKRLKKEESVNASLGTRQRELLNDVLRKTDELDDLKKKFEELQSLYENSVSEQETSERSEV